MRGLLEKGKKTVFWACLLILALMFPSIPIVNASPLYEDFTTYTEVDPNNHIEKTANHVDFLGKMDEDAYLYDDKGIGHFGNFEHLIDVKPISVTIPYNYFKCSPYALTNDLDDLKGLLDASKTVIFLRVNNELPPNHPIFRLFEYYDGVVYFSDLYSGFYGTMYYFNIKKEGTSFSAKIYSDAERTNLLETLSMTLQADHSFRYIHACQTHNEGRTGDMDLDVENLHLQEEYTVTFYNNSGGILKVNGTTVSNGTSESYYLNEVIELSGLPLNSSYRFQNFTWDSNYNKTNPYNLTLTSDLTVWCYFHKPSTFNVGFALAFVLMLMVGLILALTLSSKRR